MDIPKSKRDSGVDRGQYTPRSRSASPVQITLDLPPNARERAFREGNLSPAVSYNSRNSFYRNSPQIPAPIGDILNDEGNVGSLPNTLPEDEAAKVVKLHLVTNEDASSYMSDAASEDDYTTSHHLQGGSITRDIYKWQEDYENQVRIRRSQSFHALSDAENGDGVSTLLTPGGFRRNFLVQKAIQEGREPPNLLTNNFIDFLALYGHFAGDYYPSDDEYDDEGDEEEGDRGLGTSNVDETTPLNRTTERVKPPAPTQGTASPKKVFFLLMKSFVGTGVLFLPKSFYNGGMLFSTICLMVVAYLSLYCMLLLIESHNIVGGSFGDIGKKLYGRYARYSVLFSIVLSQLGFCCAYTIFVGKNLKELTASVTNCKFNPPLGWFIFIQLVVYIPMAMVRKIKYFSLAALIADVFILAGLGYLYYYDISKLTRLGMAHIELFNPESFALMIGTAIFTFEGIGLVLPIAESMKEPKKFPKVLSLTVFLSVSIFLSVAVLCYATFGADVKTVVLLNLPTGEPQVQMVQFLYALAITFSVPLQLFPALRILESGLFPKRSGKQQPIIKWQKNLFRAGLSVFFASIAFFGSDDLDRVVSLIGAFACVPLCFIYPAIFHYKAITSVSESRLRAAPIPVSYGRVQQIKDLILFALGLLMMFYVTYVTLVNWGASPEENAGICDN